MFGAQRRTIRGALRTGTGPLEEGAKTRNAAEAGEETSSPYSVEEARFGAVPQAKREIEDT